MRLAIFASGGGSNFQAIVDAAEAGRLQASVGLCVTNRSTAGVLERSRAASIPTCVLDPADFGTEEDYLISLRDALTAHDVDFIALAGYLRKIPVSLVEEFAGRMTNIHPALLPDFGGPGMYGRRVHAAVIESGQAFSGATVHFVDEEYDTGATILQDCVPVEPDDTPASLASRVLAIEHKLYPAALDLIERGQVTMSHGRVRITPASELSS